MFVYFGDAADYFFVSVSRSFLLAVPLVSTRPIKAATCPVFGKLNTFIILTPLHRSILYLPIYHNNYLYSSVMFVCLKIFVVDNSFIYV